MKRHKYTKELLEPIVKESLAWSEVCRKLGIKPATGSQSHIKKRAIDFEIDFSHFIGQAWNKGKTFTKKPIKEYLVKGKEISSDRLKKRLFKEGIKEKKCEMCDLKEWQGEELVFHLDHINGDILDNRLENLMITCPNCHALKTRKARMVKRQTRYA